MTHARIVRPARVTVRSLLRTLLGQSSDVFGVLRLA
jgi:hypothetical protein